MLQIPSTSSQYHIKFGRKGFLLNISFERLFCEKGWLVSFFLQLKWGKSTEGVLYGRGGKKMKLLDLGGETTDGYRWQHSVGIVLNLFAVI